MASLLPSGKQQFTNAAGQPLVGGKLWTYDAGTTTPRPTFTDAAGTIPNTNPVVLDARGEATVFWSGAYKVRLADANDATVWTVDQVISTDTTATQLADPSTALAGAALVSFNPAMPYAAGTVGARLRDIAAAAGATGGALVGFLAGGTAAVARTMQAKAREIVSVADFGALGDGTADDTAAIQAAIDSLPKFGAAGWRPCCLHFPMPGARYKVTSTLTIKNHQGLIIRGDGCRIEGNFAGVVLDIGGVLSNGTEDMLRFHMDGVEVVQMSSAAGSGAVRARHMYESSFFRSFFFGGRIAFELDGNANLMSACVFRGAYDANVKTGGSGGNNEANVFHVCSNEIGKGDGYQLGPTAGLGGHTIIDGGYIEGNGIDGSQYVNVRCTNNQRTVIRGVYFNLQNGRTGIALAGTIGGNFISPNVTVRECHVRGPATGTTPKFLEELSANSINAFADGNGVIEGLCDLLGSAPRTINARRARKFSAVTNGVSIVNTDSTGPSDGWTLAPGGTGHVGVVTSVSPYVSGSACSISAANGYQYQQVSVPANSLIRISVWARCSAALANAALQIWSVGLGGQYRAVNSTSLTANKLELFLTPAERGNAASILILLRNTGTGDAAQFCDVEIEDMTA